MKDIIIDQEFKLLFPPLDDQTFQWLKNSILVHGCREPLVLWDGMLIDGHNRYKICLEYDVPFNTTDMEFASRDEVVMWIIETQVGRRNLTQMQLSYYRGLHYNADKRSHGGDRRSSDEISSRHSDDLNEKASKRLADKYNVSPRTIERDGSMAEVIAAIGEVSPEAKMEILSERTRITRKQLREFESASEEELAEIAASIEDGTFAERFAELRGAGKQNITRMQPWEVEFGKLTDTFRVELSKLSGKSDTTEVRSALRTYIDMLEDMYGKI